MKQKQAKALAGRRRTWLIAPKGPAIDPWALGRVLARDYIATHLPLRAMAKLREANFKRRRYERRTGEEALRPSDPLPKHWRLDQQFDPFYVRSHCTSIAHAITQKIKSGLYQPRPCLRRQIPKDGGGL
jgi:hypothetical protein